MDRGSITLGDLRGKLDMLEVASMNRIISAVLLAGVMSSASAASQAQPSGYESGNSLYADCVAAAGSFEYGMCLGYVKGVADHWEVVRAGSKRAACIPDGVTTKQIVDIVNRYLAADPASRRGSAAWLVNLALVEAFCPGR
jgi:hypothetical protein